MGKLHVPPPEGVDDRSDVNLAMLAALLLACLSGILMFRQGPYVSPHHHQEAPREIPRDVYDDLADLRTVAEKIGGLDTAALESRPWTDVERRAVLRFGPRAATEVVCDKLADAISSGELNKEMRLDFERTLDRRTAFSPWTCMTRLHLDGAIPGGGLSRELEQYWAELEQHAGNDDLPISVLEAFLERRERPNNPQFYSWLRLCALDFDYIVHSSCQKLLFQMAPAQGDDLIDMIEHHWREVGIRAEDMPTIIAGLGYLAREGQPHSFKVKETPELPDYNVDFRQATIGYLCRMMNTPTSRERSGSAAPLDSVPEMAGEQLRKVGLVGARAYESKLLMRWRETCRLAFGGVGGMQDGEDYVPVPLLAVWAGDASKPADYRISNAIELDSCEKREGYPDWFCLADKWVDEERPLDRAVAHAFIKTRYMEWEERFNVPQEKEGTTKPSEVEVEVEDSKPLAKPKQKPQPAPKPPQKAEPKKAAPIEKAKGAEKAVPPAEPAPEAKTDPKPDPTPAAETKPNTE